jgi:hypothetical protein
MHLDKSLKIASKAGGKLILSISPFLILVLTQTVSAQVKATNVSLTASGSTSNSMVPALLDLLLLLGILTCFFISIKVKSFLREGEMAWGWNLFAVSFVLLFVAQFLSFSSGIRLLNVSASIVSSLRLLFVISLASGIYFMKKVLS